MKYALTIQLTKHKNAHKFRYIYTARNGEDVQGIKEHVCMWAEANYHTPCRCVKVEEI